MSQISYVNSEDNGTTYTLKLINNSAYSWTFYVYQTMPNQATSNVFSTAWFCSPFVIASGGASFTASWQINYSMLWGAAGQIQPGVMFSAGYITPPGLVDLQTANSSTFTYTNQTPTLSAPAAGIPAGSLIIQDDNNVPPNKFGVGIGMSGAGTYVTPAGANLLHTFTPTPTYWIAAGTNVQVGTILDITTVTKNLQVTFPAAIYSQTYALNGSNTWALQP